MRSPEQCDLEAERCERFAAASTNKEIRALFYQVARTWRRMGWPTLPRILHAVRLMEIGAEAQTARLSIADTRL